MLMLLMLAALTMSVLGQRVTTCAADDDCRGKQVCCDGACSRDGCADDGDDETGGDGNDDDDNDVDDGADFECAALDPADEKRCTRKTTQATCERMKDRCAWTQVTPAPVPTVPLDGECSAFEQCKQMVAPCAYPPCSPSQLTPCLLCHVP